ncbi:MAG: ATP-binding protein [Gemmatimonadaceae bacterium]|nr:ATP-binding protein [Gemmatimonadaceae bacterium]
MLDQVAPLPADAKLLIDARHCTFSSPYGFTALLTLAQTREVKPEFAPPIDENVISYWSRSNFLRYAEEFFTLNAAIPKPRAAGESDVLLEVTPIARNDDVHSVVERVKQRAQHILMSKLHLESRSVMGFAMTLSEACQNIVEHAGRGGWVAVQAYNMKKRIGRYGVVIAVCDGGVGFRRSLESGRGRPESDRWDDAIALETALLYGTSRYHDPGRGQGLKGIRGYVTRLKGKVSVRSGTARLSINIPAWDEDVPRKDGLAPFPGAQMQILIPEADRAV